MFSSSQRQARNEQGAPDTQDYLALLTHFALALAHVKNKKTMPVMQANGGVGAVTIIKYLVPHPCRQ